MSYRLRFRRLRVMGLVSFDHRRLHLRICRLLYPMNTHMHVELYQSVKMKVTYWSKRYTFDDSLTIIVKKLILSLCMAIYSTQVVKIPEISLYNYEFVVRVRLSERSSNLLISYSFFNIFFTFIKSRLLHQLITIQ